MTAPIDIWRAAHLLTQQYGPAEAPLIAAQCADALLELGDLDGSQVWMGILRAIEALSRTKRTADESLN